MILVFRYPASTLLAHNLNLNSDLLIRRGSCEHDLMAHRVVSEMRLIDTAHLPFLKLSFRLWPFRLSLVFVSISA